VVTKNLQTIDEREAESPVSCVRVMKMRLIADYTLGVVIVLSHLVRMSLKERRSLPAY
jgi:hypothetical protein